MTGILDALDRFEKRCPNRQTAQRAKRHVIASLLCLGRHTLTCQIATAGRQFQDWTADYRMYTRERLETGGLFETVCEDVAEMNEGDGPLVAAIDDTRLRKTGRKTHGVKYTRDPLGPPFHLNLIRAQRFVQVSMAIPAEKGQARMVPVDFTHAPSPDKPKKNATERDWKAFRRRQREMAVGQVGAQRLAALRERLDDKGHAHRRLWAVGDGGYTNRTVLKQLPERVTFIGRIRADAKLYTLPDPSTTRGRPRVYGERVNTPEQTRQDERIPWREVTAFAAGKQHRFRVKTVGPLRWRPTSSLHDLRLIVIAPLAYRLTKQSKTLYRRPAYLICTDPHASLEQVLQAYLWRWDIEVNFRDEKTLLGVGQAQVRRADSVANVPALAVASYAMLLVAAAKHYGPGGLPHTLPAPKWRARPPQRASTQSLINHLRAEVWGQALHTSHFATFDQPNTNCQKSPLDLRSALFYGAQRN